MWPGNNNGIIIKDGAGKIITFSNGISTWEQKFGVAASSAQIVENSSNTINDLWFMEDDNNFISGDNINSLSDMNTSENSITNLSFGTFDATSILNLAQPDYYFAPDKEQVKSSHTSTNF